MSEDDDLPRLSGRMLDLAPIRSHLKIDPSGQVELRVIERGSGLHLLFVCACENLLEWQEPRHLWICSGCGYEMTARESSDLYLREFGKQQRLARALHDAYLGEQRKVTRTWFARLVERLRRVFSRST